ncbi:methionine ABC transporter ATP-binding protein [Pajaroellobacter abortibovis]|uniref:Cell division ATP-binding protein FtsE n=1 Tax=Pajaroellobacter abortibovis TaxID=1882918 RepID=A0A1L6MXM2_9BACT|nr:ATP-binding cassette domain-containing protein [Pajaroellobacter abortibovis]APS00333.1 hypothetical protein BCY86_06315 [Pajaroellobacter abortibovis]
MILLQHLVKAYKQAKSPVFAINNIQLTIPPSVIFGIVGYSGAGKSTLLRCINLLERPDSGSVQFDGQELTHMNPIQLREVRYKIGMIFQHLNLFSRRTAYNNVALPLEFLNCPKKAIAERVTDVLELVGLSHKKDSYPHQLSGGEKQRVAIARALVSKPKVLLCDEATSALDPSTKSSILELLYTINQQLKVTIVLITHELEVVKNICHLLAVMEQGKIVEEGPPLDLFLRPKSDYSRHVFRAFSLANLPDSLRHQMIQEPTASSSAPILRLIYENQAGHHVLWDLIKSLHFPVNIVHTHTESMGDRSVCMTVVALPTLEQALPRALSLFTEHGLNPEILGYVS